jgi:hypothetical protein
MAELRSRNVEPMPVAGRQYVEKASDRPLNLGYCINGDCVWSTGIILMTCN